MAIKQYFRTVSFVLILILCCVQLSSFNIQSYAQQNGSISITVVDKETDTPVTDAVFRIYKFATAQENDGNYIFTYEDSFASNGMDMGDFSDSYFPVHLVAFAQENNLIYDEADTDASGTVDFEQLSVGAYLIVPMNISSSPFVVSVPMWNEATGEWGFYVDASPKVQTETDSDDTTHLTVKKQWEGADEHPDEITVALLKDEIISEYVVLNSSNNWTYSWDDLDSECMWNVAEVDIPSGYTASYSDSSTTIIITNTSQTTETTTQPEDTSEPDKLIQTGQLNWPVPILSITGLLLFSVGWAIINFGKKDEETQ